jgi:multidrug resistance efflux pump
MAQQGMPIPPEMLVLASPMSATDQEKLLGILEQQNQQTDPMQEAQIAEMQAKIEKMSAEIEKMSAETLKINAEVANIPGGAQFMKAEEEQKRRQAMLQQQQQMEQEQLAQMQQTGMMPGQENQGV